MGAKSRDCRQKSWHSLAHPQSQLPLMGHTEEHMQPQSPQQLPLPQHMEECQHMVHMEECQHMEEWQHMEECQHMEEHTDFQPALCSEALIALSMEQMFD